MIAETECLLQCSHSCCCCYNLRYSAVWRPSSETRPPYPLTFWRRRGKGGGAMPRVWLSACSPSAWLWGPGLSPGGASPRCGTHCRAAEGCAHRVPAFLPGPGTTPRSSAISSAFPKAVPPFRAGRVSRQHGAAAGDWDGDVLACSSSVPGFHPVHGFGRNE